MKRTLVCAWLVVCCGSLRAEEPVKFDKPTPNQPGEALAKSWSAEKAASFLDRAAVNWTRERKCGTCHTNYPYLIARPLVGQGADSPGWKEVRQFFEKRATNWNTAKPRWDTEVVATASFLAMSDRLTTGKLHPATRSALDRMWTLQKANGAWNWLKCDWPPIEHDDYFGAIVAAVGVGMAPNDYRNSAPAKAGLEKLRGYLKGVPAPDLHHRLWLAWADSELGGILESNMREKITTELLSKQRADGGWSLQAMGDWKRRDKSPNDPNADGDGYGTGLAVVVLLKTGMKKDAAAIRKAVAWLESHQTESGRWFTRSLNNDADHYITNAGSAFAVIALAMAK